MRLASLALILWLALAPSQAHAGPIIAAVVAGEALTGAVIANAVFQSVLSFALSSIASSMFGKDTAPKQQEGPFQSEASGRLQVIRSAVATRKLAYGEFMTSGPLVYAETTGSSNKILHLVIPVAPHEIAGFEEVWLNDEKVGPIDANGRVTSGRFAGFAFFWFHHGTATQEADAELVAQSAGKWTADHKLSGIAYAYVQLWWDQRVWPGGIPNIKFLIRGKPLEDPRDSSTVYTNNWALVLRDYMRTPATLGGLGVDADEVDDVAFQTAANVCDERVAMAAYTNTFTLDASTDELTLTETETTIATGDGVELSTTGNFTSTGLATSTTYYYIRTGPNTAKLATSYANALAKTAIDITGAGSGTHTITHIDQARYTANGTVDTSETPKSIITSLLSGAAGILTYPQGQFKALPAAYDTPTQTLTVADLRGPVKVSPRIARRELFNAVQGVYSNPANYWQPSSFPVLTNATYEAQDGGERITRDIELAFTTDSIRAQRIAKVHLEKSRQGMVVVFPAKFSAFRLAMWDTVYLTLDQFGWSSKVFRVINWKLAQDMGGVDITLREDTSASYDWAEGDATVVDPAPDTNLQNAFDVGIPGTPVVTEELYETTGSAGVKTRALVSYAAAADAFVSSYEAQYRAQGATDWLALSPVSLLAASKDDLAPGFYEFRVRAINSIGVSSDWSATTTKELLGLTAAPANVAGFSVIKSAGVGIAQFSLHDDLDVRIGGRIVVRWSPLTTGAVWNDSIIFEEFNGDAVSGIVPLKTGTYMAKAKDSTGHYSATAASFVATEGLVTGFTTVGTLTEHTAFTGTKTNTAVVSSGLQLDSASTIDSMVTSIDSWPFIDSIGGVSGTGSYAFSTYLDLTTVATRRFEASIAATQFDTGDLIDSRTDLIDDWVDIDGSTIEDCDATLYIRTTDDNPAGTPTYGAWTPFFVGDFTCRATQFKLDLVSGNATHNIRITSLAVSAKVPT